MQRVALYEKDSGRQISVDHIIGVDETGNYNDSEPFSVVAVLCPREAEVALAERMINAGMSLWKEKPQERLFNQAGLPEYIETHPDISWFGIGSTAPISNQDKAAAAVRAAMYTLIQPKQDWNHQIDRAALLHDGNDKMYGKKQQNLRQQAAGSIDSKFVEKFGEIVLTQSSRADQIYPSVMLADIISGQMCSKIQEGNSLNNVPNYEWFRETYVQHPKHGISDLYYLSEVGNQYRDYLWENFAAWSLGQGSAGSDSERTSIPIERLINQIDSSPIKRYLAEKYN